MSKIRNTRITVKWGFRHTCYVTTAAQNLNDSRSSHLMAKLRSQHKNTYFLLILALHKLNIVDKSSTPGLFLKVMLSVSLLIL